MMKAPHGCTLAENALVVDHRGKLLPCCRFQVAAPSPERESIPAGESILNSDFFSQLRSRLNLGLFPEGCRDCQNEESQGLQSLRLKRRGIFVAPVGELVDLELFVGSLCNMKCRMCSHNFSSLWAKEVGESPDPSYDPVDLLSKMSLSRLQHLRLLGGETLINKDFFRILDFIKENTDPGKMTLSFATNGSRPLDKKLESYLHMFKKVEVDFSIDGTGALAEYIRPGVPWSDIEKNIEKWVDIKKSHSLNWNLNAHTTIQALNTHAIFDIVRFCMDYQLTWSHRILTLPSELSWLHIPRSIREQICSANKDTAQSREFKKFFKDYGSSSLFDILTGAFPDLGEGLAQEFLGFLEPWDRKWGVSWRHVLPKAWLDLEH